MYEREGETEKREKEREVREKREREEKEIELIIRLFLLKTQGQTCRFFCNIILFNLKLEQKAIIYWAQIFGYQLLVHKK